MRVRCVSSNGLFHQAQGQTTTGNFMMPMVHATIF